MSIPDMDDDDRRKFLDNIIADAAAVGISSRLRDFAARKTPSRCATQLPPDHRFALGITSSYSRQRRPRYAMRIGKKIAAIVFSNLATMPERHGVHA